MNTPILSPPLRPGAGGAGVCGARAGGARALRLGRRLPPGVRGQPLLLRGLGERLRPSLLPPCGYVHGGRGSGGQHCAPSWGHRAPTDALPHHNILTKKKKISKTNVADTQKNKSFWNKNKNLNVCCTQHTLLRCR